MDEGLLPTSLVGKARLEEGTGDETFIISSCGGGDPYRKEVGNGGKDKAKMRRIFRFLGNKDSTPPTSSSLHVSQGKRGEKGR